MPGRDDFIDQLLALFQIAENCEPVGFGLVLGNLRLGSWLTQFSDLAKVLDALQDFVVAQVSFVDRGHMSNDEWDIRYDAPLPMPFGKEPYEELSTNPQQAFGLVQ